MGNNLKAYELMRIGLVKEYSLTKDSAEDFIHQKPRVCIELCG